MTTSFKLFWESYEMRQNPTPVTIKGEPQLITDSCATVR